MTFLQNGTCLGNFKKREGTFFIVLKTNVVMGNLKIIVDDFVSLHHAKVFFWRWGIKNWWLKAKLYNYETKIRVDDIGNILGKYYLKSFIDEIKMIITYMMIIEILIEIGKWW